MLSVCVAVAGCWACGGRASDRDGIQLEGAPDPEEVTPPAEELPGSLEVLELRLSSETAGSSVGPLGCNPDSYSTRLKVNFQTRQLVWAQCEAELDSVGTISGAVPLLDADVERVQDAYAALRVSSSEQCAPDAGIFTLDVTPEHGTHLLYGDDEHSGCALPRLQSARFVSGLDELYRLLASLAPLALGSGQSL